MPQIKFLVLGTVTDEQYRYALTTLKGDPVITTCKNYAEFRAKVRPGDWFDDFLVGALSDIPFDAVLALMQGRLSSYYAAQAENHRTHSRRRFWRRSS